MQYRSAKVKYEQLVLSMLVTLGLMGKEPIINIGQLICYKSIVLKYLASIGKKVDIDVSPKARKQFEIDFLGTIYVHDSSEYELIYELNSNVNLYLLKSELEKDLGTIPPVIYETLMNEEIVKESIKQENYSLYKRERKNQRRYHI